MRKEGDEIRIPEEGFDFFGEIFCRKRKKYYLCGRYVGSVKRLHNDKNGTSVEMGEWRLLEK